jgi:hypothetical protein
MKFNVRKFLRKFVDTSQFSLRLVKNKEHFTHRPYMYFCLYLEYNLLNIPPSEKVSYGNYKENCKSHFLESFRFSRKLTRTVA